MERCHFRLKNVCTHNASGHPLLALSAEQWHRDMLASHTIAKCFLLAGGCDEVMGLCTYEQENMSKTRWIENRR